MPSEEVITVPSAPTAATRDPEMAMPNKETGVLEFLGVQDTIWGFWGFEVPPGLPLLPLLPPQAVNVNVSERKSNAIMTIL